MWSMEDKEKIIIYQSQDNQIRLDVRLENETVWLSFDDIASHKKHI